MAFKSKESLRGLSITSIASQAVVAIYVFAGIEEDFILMIAGCVYTISGFLCAYYLYKTNRE